MNPFTLLKYNFKLFVEICCAFVSLGVSPGDLAGVVADEMVILYYQKEVPPPGISNVS